MNNWRQVLSFADYEGSGFISPQGKWISVAWGEHGTFAQARLADMNLANTMEEHLAIAFLMNRGWIRVSRGTQYAGLSIGWDVTSNVKSSLMEYASHTVGNPRIVVEKIRVEDRGTDEDKVRVVSDPSPYFDGTRQQLLEFLNSSWSSA